MDEWTDEWLPGLEADDRLVAVFATATDTAAFIDPREMALDLGQELAKYE